MADRADFAPELGALKSLRPFVFWAQTTLPTVFDDSLSYYEVLTKLTKMVNTMLENEDTNAENISALAEAYQELEDFTNNYFANLDVTQEINDKLDELVADGTIGGYVVERATTLFNDYLYGEDGESGKNKEINDMISEAQTDIEEALANFATRSNLAVTTFETNSAASIRTFENRVDEELAGVSTIVEDWMDANFTNPSSVVIDDTLTTKDAAAEAYATGKLMDDATNMVLATSYWQDYVVDSVSGSFILADASGGSNPAIGTGAPSKTLYIANVTPGETYIVSGVASSYSTTRYTPAYALGNLTYDASDNPYYEFYDVYPRGWDDSQGPGTVYQYVRNQTVRIPTGTTPTVTHLFITGDSRVPITVRCSRLNVRTDDTLTSQSLPAQGKATGDALDTKLPWPVSDGSKDLGTAGYGLVTNADGTTSWQETRSFAESPVYSSDLVPLNRSIMASGKWTTLSGATAGYIAIPSNAEKIVITPKAGVTNVWAFLNSIGTPTTGETPDYSANYPGRISDNTATPHSYAVESDMHFIYFLQTSTSNVDVFPDSVYICTKLIIDDTLSIQYEVADAKATGDAISAVSARVPESIVGTFDTNNLTPASMSGHGITPADKWSFDSTPRSFIFRIPDTVHSIKVSPNYDGTIVAFLASAPPVSPTIGDAVDFSTEYQGRIRLDVGGETDFQVRGTMHYMFILVKNSSGNPVGPDITLTANGTRLASIDTEAADESNVTDRRNEICAMLSAFGKCELGKGVFYTNANLVVPDNAVLCGSGKGTVVKLLASVESGSAIRMGPYSTVRDMVIKGSDSAQNGNETEGTRNGIEWTGETQVYGTVDNCRVINFSGGGIYLHDTTQQTYRGLSIINCNIRGNYAGIDIRKDSEFNKIVNSVMTGNNIGYRNRGGNNNIANCGLDANKTGILINNDVGTNGGHGFITNCSIDHSDSNTGYGLIIKGTGRMLVSNCNMYFSKMRLENTNGNVITGCGFGRSAGWEIIGGECSLINGCMVRGWDSENSPVTISGNVGVRIVNCFDRSGTAYA